MPNNLFTFRSQECPRRCLKTLGNYHKIETFPGSSTVERSAVDCTAEHHKPLFWRRLATKLSPLIVPQLCPHGTSRTQRGKRRHSVPKRCLWLRPLSFERVACVKVL